MNPDSLLWQGESASRRVRARFTSFSALNACIMNLKHMYSYINIIVLPISARWGQLIRAHHCALCTRAERRWSHCRWWGHSARSRNAGTARARSRTVRRAARPGSSRRRTAAAAAASAPAAATEGVRGLHHYVKEDTCLSTWQYYVIRDSMEEKFVSSSN